MKEINNMTGYASLDKPWLKYYSSKAIDTNVPKLTAYQYMVLENSDNLNNIAIDYYGYTETFSIYFEEINKVAQGFYNLGIRKGDVVTIISVATPELEKSFYALNKIGAILNLIDIRSDANTIKNYLIESNTKLLISMDNFLKEVDKIIYQTDIEKVVTISPFNVFSNIKKKIAIKKNGISKKELEEIEDIKKNSKYLSWNELLSIPMIYEVRFAEYEDNKTAVFVHTGGTTGVPKTVMLTNENMNAMALQYKLFDGEYKKGETFFNDIVPFVAYGIVAAIHTPTCLGLTNIIVPLLLPKEFTDLMIKNKPNHVLAVPTYWDHFSKDKRVSKMDLSFLKHAGSGGDSFSKEDKLRINEFFKEHNSKASIEEGYGMTELSSACAICIGKINKLTSLGIPMVKSIISLFEPETNNEIKYLDNAVGEICINSPTMMSGYYNNELEEQKVIKVHEDGSKWIHSGDLGYLDKDGFLYLVGRIKRMIIHGGFKIYPSEIEKVIASVKGVDKCCVISIPSKIYGASPLANIILKNEYKSQESEIKKIIEEKCQNELPDYSLPENYVFKTEFPMTTVGKVDYKKMESEFLKNI